MSEEQTAISAYAYRVHPKGIIPNDEEMRKICESLVERGMLCSVEDGYVASDELMLAMAGRASLN